MGGPIYPSPVWHCVQSALWALPASQLEDFELNLSIVRNCQALYCYPITVISQSDTKLRLQRLRAGAPVNLSAHQRWDHVIMMSVNWEAFFWAQDSSHCFHSETPPAFLDLLAIGLARGIVFSGFRSVCDLWCPALCLSRVSMKRTTLKYPVEMSSVYSDNRFFFLIINN